ncbi:MAG: hypothetical protein LAO23_15160 [Acidobacteriia bacterium]|nr:hypothetical protein [Terriglobia bacterium]
MHRHKMQQRTEQGFSLIVALLALMLLSAVAVGMMFIASTETAVSSNFKSEETAYFAARAGVEEVRDRMLPSPPSPGGAFSLNGSLPAFLPGQGNPWALYILNGKNPTTGADMSMGDVTGLTTTGNILADDELCHDFYGYNGMTYAAANIRCSGTSGLPAGTNWYTSTTSLAPLPVDYKWVRVTLKANNSYGASNANLFVDSTQPGANQVCLFGSQAGAHEVVAPAGTACSSLNATPVYLVTALAVSPSGGSKGAKRIVQQEIAQFFGTSNLPGGLFAVGTGCGALSLQGGANTGSFNSSTEATPTNPPSNLSNTGGDVGSNGNIFVGGSSTDVNGNIHTDQPTTIGSCPGSGVSVSGSPTLGTVVSTPAFNPSVPPMPNPLPPQTTYPKPPATMPNPLPPGAYGNVNIKGTVTLNGGTVANPAVYTINSLSFSGGATLQINGPVIFNLAGVNLNGNPPVVLDMTGGTFSNTTNVPGDFVINYGGTDAMKISGGTGAYAEVNAPNSPITLIGGSNFYGQIVGNTINDQGGTNFYWDTALVPPPVVNTTTFARIAMRELSY